MKTCSWVEPLLVAQIKFTEWTSDNQLRQPVFLGLRTDKQARDGHRRAGIGQLECRSRTVLKLEIGLSLVFMNELYFAAGGNRRRMK